MSKETKTTTVNTSLVGRIVAAIKGGEEHHVTDFVSKLEKQLEKNIKNNKLNIETKKAKFEQKLEELKDKAADRLAEAEDVLVDIDPEMIKTNDARRNYISVYLENVDRATERADKAQAQVEDAEKEQKAAIDDLQDQIKADEELLARLRK